MLKTNTNRYPNNTFTLFPFQNANVGIDLIGTIE